MALVQLTWKGCFHPFFIFYCFAIKTQWLSVECSIIMYCALRVPVITLYGSTVIVEEGDECATFCNYNPIFDPINPIGLPPASVSKHCIDNCIPIYHLIPIH